MPSKGSADLSVNLSSCSNGSNIFCCIMGASKSSGMQLPGDGYEFGFQPAINVLQLQAAEIG